MIEPGTPKGRGWRQLIGIAAGIATISASAGIAAAAGGGGVATAGGGGVGTPAVPKLSDVLCIERCADVRVAASGSRVQLDGRELADVQTVKFAAEGGGRLKVTPSAVSARTVEAKVPDGAATGAVRVDAFGTAADTRRQLKIVAPDRIPDAGSFRLTSAEASPHRTYFDAKRTPRVTYMFEGGTATDVRIQVVNLETNEIAQTWIVPAAEPNTLESATWDGLGDDGKAAADGDYRFEIGPAAGAGLATTDDSQFSYHSFRFPLDKRHTYGDGFGAGRGHEGQDVMTRCGVPIHAVRGGRVQTNDVHPAAGNYLVIDGKRTRLDFMYAHMVAPSPLREGARVRTGQLIGDVGQTGNASACHLHFEVWSAPGWYEGGHPLPSVGRLLKTWDSWS